jgi:hypothetical protein
VTGAIHTAAQNDEFQSSARLISTPPPGFAVSCATPRPAATLVSIPDRSQTEVPSIPPQESQHYASRSWHAEAWQRECERTRKLKTAASN